MSDLRKLSRTAIVGSLSVAVSLAGGLVAPATANHPGFYNTPSRLPAQNGAILKVEKSAAYLDQSKQVRIRADVHRVMYRSSDHDGTPIAVTGTVLTPRSAWQGEGRRPIIGFGVGTQGLGDQCAPSRQLPAGTEYEAATINGLIARGYGVAVTDYQGLGTKGVHTYVSREVTGHAVLDAVRAAQRLPRADLPNRGPVALVGYSQGGAATAAAAELAKRYAPQMKVKGVAAGAVPGDLAAVGKFVDGSLYFAFLGYAVAGLSASYDVNTDRYLNGKGERALRKLKRQCTTDSITKYPFVQSETLTEDGRPLTAYLDERPFRSIIAKQMIGGGDRRPSMPALVTHSLTDDVVPFQVGLDVAQRWCAQGATVEFVPTPAPTHVGGAVPHAAATLAFLEARFAGLPAQSTCATPRTR